MSAQIAVGLDAVIVAVTRDGPRVPTVARDGTFSTSASIESPEPAAGDEAWCSLRDPL